MARATRRWLLNEAVVGAREGVTRPRASGGSKRPVRVSKRGLKDKKSWWRVSPSCFGGGLCGGGRARRWRRPIWG